MPPPDYMAGSQPSYFGAMDRTPYYLGLDDFTPIHVPLQSNQNNSTTLGPRELGSTLNPMQNQLQALQAKIREGASKVEFEFMGKGKGNSQQTTPETYGREEREMMRKIAALNDVTTSTHATFSVSGLAGFGQRGFNKQQQNQTIHEVQRAIDFAKDATTGGAVVVHTGEWQRPISVYYGDEGKTEKMGFEQYEGEDDEAPIYVVDGETGELVQGISKNKVVVAPKWHTAASLEGGTHVGEDAIDINGNPIGRKLRADDWVDQNGRYINPNEPDHLFRRVPVYNADKVTFETDTLDWKDLVKRTDEWNARDDTKRKLTPEEYFAQMQIDNQVLQQKGSSLFHLQRYERDQETWEALRSALEFYEKLDDTLSDEEKWRLTTQTNPAARLNSSQFVPNKNISAPDLIRQEMKETELSMRHTHESSSSADARAVELERRREKIQTIEEYGLKQTGHALARLADEAMVKSKEARKIRSKDEKWEDLYIAPENIFPGEYGSHPEELLNIVNAGRDEFKKRLEAHHGITDAKEQERLAKKHIKTTFDIGHLNMWRHMMKRKQGESEDAFQNRFNNWMFKHLEKLHEAEAIGHLHITDNFGYNDEHLTAGQGNAPIKEFVAKMQEWGYDDFIIEAGSFNPLTVVHDTWSFLGAKGWQKGPAGRSFSDMRMQHAGWYAPPNYIVGAYVPSNEWTLWSQVPLE